MTSIQHWLATHPLTLAFGILILGAIISVFSGDIRQFVRTQPQRLDLWVSKARLKSSARELDKLQILHENTHQLLMFLTEIILWAFVGIFSILGIVAVEMIGHTLNRPFRVYQQVGDLLTIVLGLLIWTVTMVNGIVDFLRLKFYEDSVRRLERKIARLQGKLELN